MVAFILNGFLKAHHQLFVGCQRNAYLILCGVYMLNVQFWELGLGENTHYYAFHYYSYAPGTVFYLIALPARTVLLSTSHENVTQNQIDLFI